MKKILNKIFLVFTVWFFAYTFFMVNKDNTDIKYSNVDVKSSNVDDEWWKSTDEYAHCYGKITEVHKLNGLHERNRTKSIKIKEQMCKTAVTSTTGEGSYWLE
jgi:hypothetical protein